MPITINGTSGISGVDGTAGTPALQGTDTNTGISFGSDVILGSTGGTERFRCDSSGRLLVGTSTARSNIYYGANQITPTHQYEFNLNSYNTGLSIVNYNNTGYAPVLTFGLSQSATQGTNTAVNGPNTDLGIINFTGNDGTNFRTGASIVATTDAGVSTGDLPTRLVFSTTADGASSPTERMRIGQNGNVLVGTTTNAYSAKGVEQGSEGYLFVTRDGNIPMWVNRLTNDGILIEFAQATTVEGTISVSGTTVSYNGAHLSRWSQIEGIDPHDKTDRPEILRGTVMSNLDEMCDWIDPESGDAQDNEQLNKTKISDVEGDKNVAGIFQSWDDDDDTWVNDYYLAMTGDFIIRIAEGVTVERGDLLMSAGDGTAKPQDDDIVRSKTIAKVTSTNVSCTYDDGSYCVPCVLMAC